MDRAVGEDDAFVDVMITASQKKGEVILPSHGRVFVPYFMPGASNPGEHDINVNTDVDHFRRGGASFLEAPLPMPLGQEFHGDTGGEQPRTSGRRMGKKRSLVVSSAPKVAGHCNGLPKGAAVTKAICSEALTRQKLTTAAEMSTPPRQAYERRFSGSPGSGLGTVPCGAMDERFAGPAYTVSPPPSSLPLPGFSKSLISPRRLPLVGEVKLKSFVLGQQSVA